MNNRERNHKLFCNTVSSMVFQITTVICSFVLPRAILNIYGSDVNGLINSMAQFLQVIAFLELGVGAVVQSALYAPIAKNDKAKISEVVSAANVFFKKLAYILLAYMVVLVFIFPHFIDKEFGFWYDFVLIVALGIGSFSQYYFGIVDSLLLNALQKGYVQNNISTITLILNTVACYILVYSGFSIQFVKIVTAAIFLIRPVWIRIYINRYYLIDRKHIFTASSIPQKWNGVAQHMAAIVLDGTDVIVLSLFASLSDVSVYSIYNAVVYGIRQIFGKATNGVMALFGDLWTRKEYINLNSYFEKIEIVMHAFILLIWGCTYRLVVPFAMTYTKGVTDVNYNVPIFAVLITLASALYCVRFTYNSMILAAGHYKETQHIFVIAAVMNVVSSIILVKNFGLIGVAIGTIVAISYQTVHMQYYCIGKLKIYSYQKFFKLLLTDAIALSIFIIATSGFNYNIDYILDWIIISIKVFSINTLSIGIAFIVFYKKHILKIIQNRRFNNE